jgi:glucose/arabinose dehydrogenase
MRGKKPLILLAVLTSLMGGLSQCRFAAPPTRAVQKIAATILPSPTAEAATATQQPEKTSTSQPTKTVAPTEIPPTETEPPASQNIEPKLEKLAEGFDSPVFLTHNGQDNWVYVVEQKGVIKIVRDGTVLDDAFLDIQDRVGSSGNEQGLLGLAFAPDFDQSKKFFVNYTDKAGDTVVAGFFSNADHISADADSEWTVLQVDQPYANHNGGHLEFGPDNMLYIGLGDGGSQGDPQNHAQRFDSLLGKILRIDVSQSTKQTPYDVPIDNPKLGAKSRGEIWALGLRNPWRFTVAALGVFIGDVGQNKIEEVSYADWENASGANYGWKLREGSESYSGARKSDFIEPIAEYEHGSDGCSITGGYVYEGSRLPLLKNVYIYGDYCSGKIWALRQNGSEWMNESLFDTDFSITSFGLDALGDLYILDREGTIYKLSS